MKTNYKYIYKSINGEITLQMRSIDHGETQTKSDIEREISRLVFEKERSNSDKGLVSRAPCWLMSSIPDRVARQDGQLAEIPRK